MSTSRLLLCITVYNGRDFTPRALRSAARLSSSRTAVDVLVLDDCSPQPGWSEELQGICEELGLEYYRSPRNLGIPRNVNLGLLTALRRGYDHVVISNSDVIYPSNLVDGLLEAAEQPGVGSVTAWSNNVSIYSLPNGDPDRHLADQDVVDWVSATVEGNFRGAVMDIPAGISFCMLVPTPVLREVGLMDPVFGRGYCEETDWTLRSQALGYRIGLAPGVFVYHAGGGSNREAGLLSSGETTVPQNEAIIDLRYPQFRDQVAAFESSDLMPDAVDDALAEIFRRAGEAFGYSIEVGWLPRSTGDTAVVRAVVAPDGLGVVRLEFKGFEWTLELDGTDAGITLREFFGCDPVAVNLYDHGVQSRLLGSTGSDVRDLFAYPTRV